MDINKLKELRLQRKIKVNDMAKALGVSRNTIHLLESGKGNTTFVNIQNYINKLGDVELVLTIKC